MTTKAILFFTFIWSISIFPTSAQESTAFDPGKAHYAWPTEASSYLSSTFGETRAAHFHAALDIKTWGRRGYKVYATRNGIVDRIAIGPRGYGKVIYLKHDDGSYSIYAHLLAFNDELQQLADSTRFANDYQFELDRFLGWKNIMVEKGEVIGYSGASGIGPPHLHFELRTPNHHPYNPLLTNLSIADNIPPQIRGLSIEPLSSQSSIEGQNAIYTSKAQTKAGHYDFGSVAVEGPIGLGVNVFDQANRVNNSYAVYELSMAVDGKTLFHSKVDSFSYQETNQMFIDRVYPILKNSRKGFQRLYIADGNTLPFYNTDAQKGILDLPPGKHNITIKARDFFGNSSTASLTLEVKASTEKSRHQNAKSSAASATNITSPHNWQWFSDWVLLSNQQLSNIVVGISGDKEFTNHENGIAVKLKDRESIFMNIPGHGPITFYRSAPYKSTFISTSDGKHFARFPAHTFYDQVSVAMSVQQSAPDAVTVDIIPEAFPLKDTYSFHIARDSGFTNSNKYAFYYLDKDDEEWEYIPTRFSEEYIIAQAESLGTFALKKDSAPPTVSSPRLQQRRDGKWIIFINATDNLSGLDYKDAKITVNGIRGIAEFEHEDDRLVYYHPNFIPSQSIKVNVSISDKAGNKTEQTFHLNKTIAK